MKTPVPLLRSTSTVVLVPNVMISGRPSPVMSPAAICVGTTPRKYVAGVFENVPEGPVIAAFASPSRT